MKKQLDLSVCTNDAVEVANGNALLQSLPNLPDTFEELSVVVFSLVPKAPRVDFVTDTYLPMSIKSLEMGRRG